MTPLTDLLPVYLRLALVIRGLVGKCLEHGPDERRGAFMMALVEEQKGIGRAGVWN